MKKKQVTGGVYLVLNPSMEIELLIGRLSKALEGGVHLLQIWNNWPTDFDRDKKKDFIDRVAYVCRDYSIPILINEEWELVKDTPLSGVHFDHIPENFDLIKETLPYDTLIGITCSNDLQVVQWADQHQLDYISFCAMFPSSSVDTCEIVSPDTLLRARAITSLPLFVSGGITPENVYRLQSMDIAGIAVISGIMNSDSPKQTTLEYLQALKNLKI